MIEIHFSFYVGNVKLLLSKKSQFKLVEKIEIKIKIARAHHFFNFQRTRNKNFLCGLTFLKRRFNIPVPTGKGCCHFYP